VLGPSTPLLPAVFADYGVTHLSGMRVIDAASILRTVSEAGGTRLFKGAVQKINLIIAD
jgi:uncharacterized protein (DUF4213/DUF364 family)